MNRAETPTNVLQLVHLQQLPGRQFGSEWRFLSAGPDQRGLLSQCGAIHDDHLLKRC
jgi:hypothetical protein